jgi:hypothetical protein
MLGVHTYLPQYRIREYLLDLVDDSIVGSLYHYLLFV